MPTCTIHTNVETQQSCQYCGRSYCENCLLTLGGRVLCSQCKMHMIRGLQTTAVTFRLPNEALVYSLVGLICCVSVLFEPIALVKASGALRAIRENPALPGHEKAVTAMVIAIVRLAFDAILAVIFIVAFVSAISSR